MMYSASNDMYQTMANSGAGPTAAADVVATMKDDTVTPWTLAELALKWGCRTRFSGTSYSFFGEVAKHYGFKKFVETNDWAQVEECVGSGGLVVCVMAPGFIGLNGAFVVVYKHTDRYVYFYTTVGVAKRCKADEFKVSGKRYFCYYPEEASNET